jgi:dTMP kinase
MQLILSRPVVVLANKYLLRSNEPAQYVAYTTEKKTLFKRHALSQIIYRDILSFDYVLQLLIKIKLPLMCGAMIVCDRYIYDTVITDWAVDMGFTKEQIVASLNTYLKLLPKPDIIFLVDVDENIAFSRKADLPSIDYLKDRRNLYLDIAKDFNMEILNGNRSQKDVFAQCVNVLKTKLELV